MAMSTLAQRLRQLQMPVQVEVEDLSHLSLEELSGTNVDSAPVEPMQPARRQGQTHGVHFASVPPGYGGKMGYGTRPVSILDYDLKHSDTGSPCAATTDVEHGECPGADHASSGGPSTCSASARAHDLRHRLSEDWSADAHTMIHPHASADW